MEMGYVDIDQVKQETAARTGLDPIGCARSLGPVIVEAADEIERTQSFPEPLRSMLYESRLARMLLPRSVGGDEVQPWVYLQAIETLSYRDGAVGWNMSIANSLALIVAFIPLETAQAIYADPNSILAAGPPGKHHAIVEPGGYRITGEWNFASGSRQANWMAANCPVIDADGSVRLNRFGRPSIQTLLFRKEHATPIQNWDPIGMRGSGSEGYRVQDLFVPEAYSGSFHEDPASRRVKGRLYAFTTQGFHALGVTSVALGIARAMLDAFIALAAKKVPRGLQRLADSPVVQSGFGRQEAALRAAREGLIAVLKNVWDNADDVAPINLEDRIRVRLSCAHAIDAAIAACDFVYRAAGTAAIVRGSPFERRFRDIHTVSQQFQAREAHYEEAGRVIFNGDPEQKYL